MSERVRTGLLAAAAVASIALAGVRIAGAAGRNASNANEQTDAYGTTPALAAAQLAKLRTPAGFRPNRCKAHVPDARCFGRSRSIPLDHAPMERLVASFGVRRASVFRADPVGCFHTKHFEKPRLTLQACHAEALLGDERLVIFASSWVLAGPDGVHGTTRTLPGGGLRPSEITVDVVGHILRRES